MPQHSKENILAGRTAVDAYRADHAKLYDKPWHRGIPEEHTPLLNDLSAKLEEEGFTSLDEFFHASRTLNVQELGFDSLEEFSTVEPDGELNQAYDRMWR